MANQINPELLNRLTTWFNPATTFGQKQAMAPSQFASLWGPGGEGGTETRSLYGDNGYFDQGTNSTYFGGGGKWGASTPTAFSGYDIRQPGAGAQGSNYQRYGQDGGYLGEGTFPKRSGFTNFMNSDLAANLIFGGGILGAGALVGAGAGGAAAAAGGAGAAPAYGANLAGGFGSTVPAGAGYGISTLPELAGASYGASGLGLDAAMGSAGGNLAGGAGGDVLADATPGSFNAAADSQAANQALGLDAYSGEIPSVTVNGAPGGSFLDRLSSAAGNLFGGSGTNTISNGGGFNWGSLIGPSLSAGSAIYGANAAKSAAGDQLQATREASALQEPFRQGGMAGMNRLLDLYGLSGNTGAQGYGSAMKKFGVSDFQADPGYQFRQQQGEQGLTRAAAASGRLGSGKYLKDAISYNQGLASDEYGKAYDRYGTDIARQINPLQALMGSGQSAANTIGEYTTQGGNAQAAGKVGQANALTGAIGQGLSMYQNSQQQQQNNLFQQALMNRWLGGN